MPYPLKGNYRKNMPLKAISAGLLNWLVNFFNTCNWDGFVVTLTQNGRNCRISTRGVTQTIQVYEDWYYTDSVQLTIVDGRITEIEEV